MLIRNDRVMRDDIPYTDEITHWELCRHNKQAGLEGDKWEIEIARDQAQCMQLHPYYYSLQKDT